MNTLPALTLLLLGSLAASALDLYVAPQGRDDWSGRLPAPDAAAHDGPLATLTRARDTVREQRATRTFHEPVIVHVRAGLYALPETLKLDASDSGTAEEPVLFRAYGQERPILTGGLAVAQFTPWRDHVLQASLPALKGVVLHQLIFDGERQPLARYPNFDPANPYGGGWAYAAGEMWPMYAEKEGENKQTLAVQPRDWRAWARPAEVEVFIFPRFNWWNDILRVKSTDPATHTVTTVGNASYAMRANDRYYFQNALEELDAPGEWYFDKEAAILYFWPPAELGQKTVLVPRLQTIVDLSKTAYVTLQGFDFQCCEGTAVVLRDTEHCTVAASRLRDVGGFSGSGVTITGGHANGVIGCDISGAGRNAISLSGGDRRTLTAAGNYAENCYLHHPGVFYKQGVGVALDGVGQRVSHCLIHDTPRFAIQFSGNNHVLEYNHLRHLALETEDVGATYCGGRDWLGSRGSVIRYNFIHDVLGFGWNGKWTSPYFAWGVYLDDNTGGVDVIGNIVARCGRSLLHGHSARDCLVENNVFIEGGQRQWEFNGWTTAHHFWTEHLKTMQAGYDSVAQEPAWQSLRGMQLRPENAPDAEGRVMSGNEFHRNIIAWQNPEARALNVANFDPARNHFDDNLYWHHGLPLLTGQHQAGQPISENLLANPGFAGELGQLPPDWQWQIRPRPDARAVAALEGDRPCLQIEAALNPDKQRDNYPIITAKELELQPGTNYRLAAKMRSDHPGAKASLMLQFYAGPHEGQPAHFWASSPSETTLTGEWKEIEYHFTIPAQGERGWYPEMKKFRVRIDWKEPAGSLYVQDPLLQRVETMSEWASWQEMGDRHSIIADPKFVAPEKDDYRLQPDSPALALGFKPIPVGKIGPYADPLRASWPIVEAPGSREHPATVVP